MRWPPTARRAPRWSTSSGIEPGSALQELERAILRQDPALAVAPAPTGGPERPRRATAWCSRPARGRRPARPARPRRAAGERRRDRRRHDRGGCRRPGRGRRTGRAQASGLRLHDAVARAAVFTSLAPGADLARLALEQDVDLALVDAPGASSRMRACSPCSSTRPATSRWSSTGQPRRARRGAVHGCGERLVGGRARRVAGPRDGEHARLAGATTGPTGRDASRLLANASLAVQRTLGVTAEPMLVQPEPEALVEAARDAAVVVVGLTDRWRREGVGRARTALAGSAAPSHAARAARPASRGPRAARQRDPLHLDTRRRALISGPTPAAWCADIPAPAGPAAASPA